MYVPQHNIIPPMFSVSLHSSTKIVKPKLPVISVENIVLKNYSTVLLLPKQELLTLKFQLKAKRTNSNIRV